MQNTSMSRRLAVCEGAGEKVECTSHYQHCFTACITILGALGSPVESSQLGGRVGMRLDPGLHRTA